MNEDISDQSQGPPGGFANDPPIETRISTARKLLEEIPSQEYNSVAASQRALIQEAIEFLGRIEHGSRGEIRRD